MLICDTEVGGILNDASQKLSDSLVVSVRHICNDSIKPNDFKEMPSSVHETVKTRRRDNASACNANK